MVNMARKLDVFEILERATAETTKGGKINVLKENECMPLKDVLRGCFDDTIQWNLPTGTPPFTPNRPESVPSTLLKQHMQLRFFVKGVPDGEELTNMRREKIFTNILEGIHPKDADILVLMINKKAPAKGITKKLVQEAFPGLIVS